jgi:N-acetylmuramoyl-L-alanine amidase
MNRRDALRVIATLVASGVASLAIAAPKVLAVRAWPGRNSTRVTIESDEELRFFVSTLANPDRAIVDLADVRADQAFQQALETLKSDTGVVARARIGQFRPETARLVLELKGGAETAAFALPPVGQYKHRLVIDLTPTDSDPIAEFLTKLAERESQLERMQQEAAKGGDALEKTPGKPVADAVTKSPSKPSASASVASAKDKPSQTVRAPNVTRPYVVVLDPGHGGEDPGAIGPAGTYEKNVVLAIAQKTKFLLEQDKRFVVFMTRDEDVFIPLADRVKKARRVNADVFVSIHADAFTRREARGSSVYALSERGASSAAARWIADKENQSDLIGGARLKGRDPELAKMIFEMNQSITNADSAKLGSGLLSEIKQVNRMHKERLEFANFAVLRAPDVPSILIETAFISNPEEEKKLASDAHQLRLARAIRSGIRRFVSQQPLRA